MALFRCGGGGADLPKIGQQPDAEFKSDNLGTSGTTTIAVTKKPRYCCMSIVGTGSSSYFYMFLIDFENNKAWRFARPGSSAMQSEETDWTTLFSSVSDTAVVFINNSINTTKRIFIALYY